MNEFKQQLQEIEILKEKQALHRQQLEKNRQLALDKKKQAKKLILIGKAVSELFPDMDFQSKEEIQEYLLDKLQNCRTKAKKN